MSDDAISSLFFEEGAYALVIGISEYEHSQPADEKKVLEPENFRPLNFAAKDAKDFATFLKGHGFVPDNVTLLCNKEATSKNIKLKFGKLIADCKAAANPKGGAAGHRVFFWPWIRRRRG